MKKIVIISATVLSLILGVAAPVYTQENKKDKQDHPNQPQNGNGQGNPEKRHGQEQNQDRQQQQGPQQRQAQQQQQQNQERQQQQKQNQDRQQQQAKQQQQQNQDRQQQQKQDQNRQQEQRIQQQQNQDRQQQQAKQQQQQQDQSRKQQQGQNRQEEQRAQQQHYPQRSQEQQRVWQTTWQSHRAGNWQSDHRSWRQRGGYNGYRIPNERYRGYFGPQHWFSIYGLPFAVYNGYPRFQYEGYWITLLDPWPAYWSNDWYDNDDVYVDYNDDGYYMYNRRYPGVAIAINISM